MELSGKDLNVRQDYKKALKEKDHVRAKEILSKALKDRFLGATITEELKDKFTEYVLAVTEQDKT